jgi:hypothetical protein
MDNNKKEHDMKKKAIENQIKKIKEELRLHTSN